MAEYRLRRRQLILAIWFGLMTLVVLLLPACHTCPEGLAATQRTASGSTLRWTEREVVLRLSPEHPGADMKSGLADALRSAAAIWNDALEGCGAPRFSISSTPLSRPAIREDLVSEVLFHEREWCPPHAVDSDECHDREVQASTHLYPTLRPGAPSDGALREADLEINGVDFHWSDRGEEAMTLSLEAMLVHELGHMLGLTHPCAPRNSPERKAGEATVSCDDERVQQAVMHPRAGELLAKRTARPLRAEIAAICDIYSHQH